MPKHPLLFNESSWVRLTPVDPWGITSRPRATKSGRSEVISDQTCADNARHGAVNKYRKGPPVGLCWFMLVYVGLCWFMLVYVGLCWFMLVYVGLCWFMLVYVGLCWFITPINQYSYLYSYIYHKPELIQPLINQLNAILGAPSCTINRVEGYIEHHRTCYIGY